ncbi:MAG: hypothetical protein P0Y55_17765 [Candidatus Cohnella colombiensis]|uniref:Uncharacterized protein n=1 Tax=Candidatus Cohnella colombiensis TaxID=3121368 RepID=A0AA95EYK5_9BACL|nr:MAG: hypothetical protein P0Y55_17765 [Cohnella sp.]
MSNVKFYSEYDMACGWEIDKIIKKIDEHAIETDWFISDLIDFHNIIKYIAIKRIADYIVEQTGIDIKEYQKKIKQKIGQFIGENKSNFILLYDDVDFMDTEDFLEILENFSIYEGISEDAFKDLLNKEYVHIYIVLKFKKLIEYFDAVVREIILSDSRNAETIISKYLKESQLYLPLSLTEEEALSLIDDYIDSPNVNINDLRKIVNFPPSKGINIPDKIKLHAKRKAKEEEEKIFSKGTGIESGVSISYPMDQDEVISINADGNMVDIKVSRKWLEENLDYPTLWNNFIYLFYFVDDRFRLVFASKKNDMSALEYAMSPNGGHIYNTSFAFEFREMIGNAQIYSYTKVLSVLGVRLEDMIEWFFQIYVKKEFKINDFIVKMPSEDASYFEKCRTILPEIDRVFKQYNVLIEDGEIDQELIQMSSSSVKNKDIKSLNEKKYVYPSSKWCQTASYLLFSNQSGIFYLPSKGEKHKNFMDLIIKEKVTRNEFKEYQIQRMKWLFDNNLIRESDDSYIEFTNIKIIYVLKELYYRDVLSYWNFSNEIKKVIDNLASRSYVSFESTLLSRNEQDYFDFYLNKTKFTNGHDLRNRYLHGTNSNDEKQYEADYYSILKLIVIIIIKINDDLCIKENNSGLYD